MLSIVTTGRNDNYGGDFVGRAGTSINQNLGQFVQLGVEFEYIIVEWMPFKKYLLDTHEFFFAKDFFPELREVIIDRSIAEPEKLNPDIYFEYFAKNAGIRRTKYDNVLIINADIILPEETCKEIVELCQKELDPNKFYRNRYRYNGDQLIDLHNPAFADACICGAYSGDFLLIDSTALINVGQGYNEDDPEHRVTYQTGMDGEILWNMYNAGMRLEFLQNGYKHIPHGKDRGYDNYKIGQSYHNKPYWGFVNYPSRFEKDGRIEVVHYES